MWCVSRDQTKGCASSCKRANFLHQVIGHPGQVVRIHEIESPLQANAVNDELWITPVAGALAIKRDDSSVIINGAFRTEATDDSERLHVLITNPPLLKLRRDMWTRINTNSENDEIRITNAKRITQ